MSSALMRLARTNTVLTAYIFFCSSFISRHVLQLNNPNAMQIRPPPKKAARDSGMPVIIQSTTATRKIVSRAATEESTGDVKDIRTRKDPENTAFDRVEMARRVAV